MNDFFNKLSSREWLLLTGGLAVLLFTGLYAFVYMPILDEQKKLDVAIENQQQIRVFLAAASTEAASLRQNQIEQPDDANNTEQSPMAIIDASSQQLDIKACIKRIAPDDSNLTSLWLEKCPFDKLTYWLAILQKQHGLAATQIQLTRDQTINRSVSGKLQLGK
ncbi:hypothetical protein JCM14076_27290 [Methylosoma difficile]